MACCVTAQRHCPSQCWLIISEVYWHYPTWGNELKSTVCLHYTGNILYALSVWVDLDQILALTWDTVKHGRWYSVGVLHSIFTQCKHALHINIWWHIGICLLLQKSRVSCVRASSLHQFVNRKLSFQCIYWYYRLKVFWGGGGGGGYRPHESDYFCLGSVSD